MLTLGGAEGVTVTVLLAEILLPQLSVIKLYKVTFPAVGKLIVAVAPVAITGVPDALKLQE